jgi:hypothetical protein
MPPRLRRPGVRTGVLAGAAGYAGADTQVRGERRSSGDASGLARGEAPTTASSGAAGGTGLRGERWGVHW